MIRSALVVLMLVVLFFFLYFLYKGFPYYILPLTERPHSQLHDSYKPGGFIGHGLGMLGGSLALLVFLYPVRKKWRRLYKIGKLENWFYFHIAMGISASLIILIHSAFKFKDMIASLSYAVMIAVFSSGFIGLFLHRSLLKSVSLLPLSANEIPPSIKSTRRYFNWFYKFHKPCAFIVLITMWIHIVVTVVFGYRWIF